jgi:HlyD family secretion protein
MSAKPITEKISGALRRPWLVIAGVAVIAVVLFFALRPSKATTGGSEFYVTKRGDFTVSIVEPGTLGAVSEVSVRSEVEGTARIIWIVPEGSYVKKGELLVELDSAQAGDQVNQQEINYEKAKFALEQAQATLEIQKSATNSDFLAADLKLKFAKIDKQKYDEGQRLVDLVEASNKLVQARSQLEVNLDTYSNSVKLASKGYETRQKVESDRLSVLNMQNSVIIASNSLWMLERFDIGKNTQKYQSDVLQAEQELLRVVNQNRRKMAQYEADALTQENTLRLSEQKLTRDKKNLGATKIYAPQEGLVVYQVSENRFSSESLIEGGAVVRNRQELIKLPDLSRMKVTVKIHESHVNSVRPGQPAFVILDSAPEVRHRGWVEKVAPLPDTQMRWGNPNLKVYNTDIHLAEAIPNVKPGVSAKAEIIVTNIANALTVPIQAVTTLRGKQVVYVAGGPRSEPRPVEVGMQHQIIEISKGLNEKERVLLAPPFDLQDKDLEGGVLTADERASEATNAPARPTTTPPAPGGPGQLPGVGQPIAAVDPGGVPDGQAAASVARAGGQRSGFNREEMMKQYDKNSDGELDDTERETMRTAMAARFGQGGPGGQAGSRGGFNREEMMKQYDKNSDGELDETEREAMRTAMAARFAQAGQAGEGGQSPEGAQGGQRRNREEMMKQFDKNGDGELDEEERNAMRASSGGGDRQRGGQGRGNRSGGAEASAREGSPAPQTPAPGAGS